MEILIPMTETGQISEEAERQLELRALANKIVDEHERDQQTGSLSYLLENGLTSANRKGLYAAIVEVCYERSKQTIAKQKT